MRLTLRLSPEQRATAIVERSHRFDPFLVALYLCDLVEAVRCALQELLMKSALHRSQCVMNPLPLAAHRDELRPLENCQMTRHLRLGRLQDCDDIAYAHFALVEQVQDSQPHAVAERLKHEVN
jgi:hypothetical protein